MIFDVTVFSRLLRADRLEEAFSVSQKWSETLMGAQRPCPHPVMGTSITVQRREFIHRANLLSEAVVPSTHYVSGTAPHLLQIVEYGEQRQLYLHNHKQTEDSGPVVPPQIRRSEDNGRTWRVVGPWQAKRPLQGNRYLSCFYPSHLYHSVGGTVVRYYNTTEAMEGMLPWEPGSPELTHGRVVAQWSHDGGQTWGEVQPVIVAGGDLQHWAPGIVHGVDRGVIDNEPVYVDDRTVLLPLSRTCYAESGHSAFFAKSAVLIGRWGHDGRSLTWELGSYLALSPRQSDQGACEMSLSLLPGGRLFATLRARIYGNGQGKATGTSCRYAAFSDDLGKTWSVPEPLRYDDGGVVFAPASMGKGFYCPRTRHSYLITNMLDRPTTDCDPRTALQIAELDPQTMRLRRDTVTVIEQRDPERGDAPTIRFSNWSQYEDRETGELVVIMTGCPGNNGRHEQCGVPPHAYEYRIAFAA